MRITLEGSVGSVGMGGGRNISDRGPEPDGVELGIYTTKDDGKGMVSPNPRTQVISSGH